MAAAVGLVGTVIGGAIGGPIGAQIGGLVFGVLGNALFPPPAQEGPRLSDRKVSMSAYGTTVPWVVGAMRVAGNCFWASDIKEHKHTTTVGKGGGPKQNTYTYTVDIAFLLCQGEIAGVRTIWANGKKIWDAGSNNASTVIASSKIAASIKVYTGSEDQMPDPIMQAKDGVENTPAYRGKAYIILQEFDLTDYGGRIPNLEFEPVAQGDQVAFRRVSYATIALNQIGSPAQGLFPVYTEGNYYGGRSFGYPIIASVGGGSIDIVAQRSLTDVDAARQKRWTLDGFGNIIGGGGAASEYPEIVDGEFIESGAPYTSACNWIGKAGSLNLYINRSAPFQINGWSISDVGDRLSSFDAFATGQSPTPHDNSIIMSTLRTVATGFIKGAYPSADGSVCLILTGDGGRFSGPATRWHRFRFAGSAGYYDGSGDIDGGISLALGNGGYGRQTGNFGACSGMLESDGTSLWFSHGDSSGNYIHYATIDDAGVLSLSNREDFSGVVHDDSTLVSVFADGGVCTIANRHALACYTSAPSVSPQEVPLAWTVGEHCKRSGMQPADYDVSALQQTTKGLMFGTQMSYRAGLEQLFTAYFVKSVEIDGKIKFINLKDTTPVAEIYEDELAAASGDSMEASADPLRTSTQQLLELPRELSVDYYAFGAAYNEGSQHESIQTADTVNVVKIQLAMALDDNEAKSIAATNLYMMHAARDTYEFTTNLSKTHLIPTDVILMHMKNGDSKLMRITQRTDNADGTIAFKAAAEDPSVYDQPLLGGVVTGGSNQEVSTVGLTDLIVLDAPALQDSYGSVPTVFHAANGLDTSWRGAGLLQSFDGGDSYQDTNISFETPSIVGRAVSVLPPPPQLGMWDDIGFVDVFLSNRSAELVNDSEKNVLAGYNAASIGGEIIGFRRARPIGPAQYRLAGLLRAQRGTEDFTTTHAIGEDFVLLSTSTMRAQTIDSSLIGSTLAYKAVTFGGLTNDSRNKSKLFTARNMRPLSPVQWRATKAGTGVSSDWTFGFTRRTRVGGAWRDNVDASYVEGGANPGGTFEIDIYAYPNAWPEQTASYVKRTLTGIKADLSNAVYTVAQQIADFGAATDSVIFKIYERNDLVGRSPAMPPQRAVFNPIVLNGGPATVVAPPTPGAPTVWDNLFTFQGLEGQTTTTDQGHVGGLEMLFGGGAVLSSTGRKFGVSSARLNNAVSPAYLYSDTPTTVFQFGTRDFTLGLHFKVESVAGSDGFVILDTRSSPADNDGYFISLDSVGRIRIWNRPRLYVFTSNITFPLDGRYAYLEMVQKDGVITFSVNGKPDNVSYTNNMNLASPRGYTLFNPVERNGYAGANITLAMMRIEQAGAAHVVEFNPPPDLLMHFDGANGQMTTVDSSYNAATIGQKGTARLSTAWSAYGPSSGQFDGNDNRFTVPAHPSFNFGAGDFTVEVSVNTPTTFNGAPLLQAQDLSNNANRAWGLQFNGNSSIIFYYTTGGSNDSTVSFPATLTPGAKNTVRFVRKGGTIYGLVNGVLVGSTPFTAMIFPSTADLCVGTFGKFAENGYGYLSYVGFIDEIAVWKDIGLSDATYTPLAHAYEP